MKTWFLSLRFFECNLHRYAAGDILGENISERLVKYTGVGLCVALQDAHWSALYV